MSVAYPGVRENEMRHVVLHQNPMFTVPHRPLRAMFGREIRFISSFFLTLPPPPQSPTHPLPYDGRFAVYTTIVLNQGVLLLIPSVIFIVIYLIFQLRSWW